VNVIRLLWEGGVKTFRGCYFAVEQARLYTLPEEPPSLMIAASNPGAAELAGRRGDAMINTEAEGDLIQAFDAAGGDRKPRFVEMTVCWAKDERRARKTAHEIWALSGLQGMLFTELPTPSLFESAMKPITEDAVAEAVICGPDPKPYIEKIKKAERTGYTHVCLHQVGPEQDGFMEFCQREIFPAFAGRTVARGARIKVGGRRAAGARH
jgi:G6PDH family F420-dependent oxidoreductase